MNGSEASKRRAIKAMTALAVATLAQGIAASEATAQTAAGSSAPSSASASASAPGEAVTARFDATAKQLLYKTCAKAPCDMVAAETLRVDTPELIEDAMVALDAVPLSPGHSLLHAEITIDATHVWEALIAPLALKPVLFSGWTGYTRGEPGERSGVRVDDVPRSDGTESVVLGELHEDRKICGQQETLVETRAVDPTTYQMRLATVPRLDAAARAKAQPLPMGEPVSYPRPLSILARASATSAEGSASALSDGDLSTSWHETRLGDGHGEFVTFTTDPAVPIRRIAFVLAPAPAAAASASASASASTMATPAAAPTAMTPPLPTEMATPETVDMVAEGHLYAVTFAGGMKHPGEAYVADLPQALTTSCLSIVLDRPETEEPHPVVTLSEVTAYGAFDAAGASLGSVATKLGDPTRGEEAAAVLERAGDDGVKAAQAVFGTLDAAGRQRAVAVAASGTCEGSAELLVRAYVEKIDQSRVETKLRRCEGKAAAAVSAALKEPAATPDLGRLAAEVAPDESLDQLILLTNAARTDRTAWREALDRAASRATAQSLTAELNAKRSPELELTLVRGLGRRAGDPELALAAVRIAAKAAASTNASERYLAVDPLVAIARASIARDQATTALARLAKDDAWTVRFAVAERAGSLLTYTPDLANMPIAAADDASPRVREAAIRSLGEAHLAPDVVAKHASPSSEIWTFVRLAAIATLGTDGETSRARSDDALARAADTDTAASVRTAALDALAGRGGAAAKSAVIRALERDPELAEVRVHAASAAGRLCLHEAEDRLMELAAPLAASNASEDAMTVARVSIAALGRLHPSDLSHRMARFDGSDTSPEARAVIRQALLARDTCPSR